MYIYVYIEELFFQYLLINMKISPQKMQELFTLFKTIFLKSHVQDQQVQAILKNASIITPNIYDTIFANGDKINQYFFLIDGVVGLFRGSTKSKQPNDNDQVDIVKSYKVIGEYFCTLHTLREFTAIVKSDTCQIVKVDKQLFDYICSEFIQQYNQVQRYAKNTLKLAKKINSFQIFTLKSFRLGRCIKLKQQIGVIVRGQCKVMLNMKNEEGKKQCKDYLPSILKVKQKTKKRQVALLGINQWIFTQNLQEQFQSAFNYVACSENLCLLTISIQNICVLEPCRIVMLHRLYHDRMERIYLRDQLHTEICQQTSSCVKIKQKIDETDKILMKLDPNLSPNAFLKKYKLGYNYIRYENRERIERNSLIIEAQRLKKQKTQRKLVQYYKIKDWSQYVKIPNTKI